MFRQLFARRPKYSPITQAELLDEYALTIPDHEGQIFQFDGIGDKDAYNPSLIIQDDKKYLAVRVESRASRWQTDCYDPQVIFFEQKGQAWAPVPGAPIFDMEDPFSTWVHDKGQKVLILGGVIASQDPDNPTITTVFYKGKDIMSLEKEPFARIPNMKDIRIVELSDNQRKIVCTRPRGGKAGLGMIGVAEIAELDQLTPDLVENAPLLSNQVASNVKMGPNELYCIHYQQADKTVEYVGVIGHASFQGSDDETEHYYVVAFCFDPNNPLDNPSWLRPKIIAKRSDFGPAPTKEPRLTDVLFPGGIEDLGNNMVCLYTGISDAHVGSINIPNPFAHCHIISK